MKNKISGVYKITNTITGDFYIGSSVNIKHRWTDHKSPSALIHQPNSRLYKDMAQYGLNSFSFEIIEETTELKEREQYWIDKLKPNYNNYRASGFDIERRKKYMKEYGQTDKCKESRKTDKYKKIARKSSNKYYNKLCSYEGETLSLGTLRDRFRKLGIANAAIEAKKYLLEN